MAYYFFSRGRFSPSELYRIKYENKGEYKLLQAFYEKEIQEEIDRIKAKQSEI